MPPRNTTPSTKDLKITKEIQEATGVVFFQVEGSLSSHTFDMLEAALQEQFQAGRYKIILDMSGIDYISSAGAGVLMNAHLQAQDRHGAIVLANPSTSVRDSLTILNLINVIPSAPDRAAALALLQTPRA